MRLEVKFKSFSWMISKNRLSKRLAILFFLCLWLCPFKTLAFTVEDQIDDFIYPKELPEKVVYLTFDDGPSEYSLQILNLLKEYEVPAIFFVIGENINQLPNAKELLNQMINEGHYIGLHSMTHNMNQLYDTRNSPQHFVKEMLEAQQLVYDLTNGFESQLCRPPYGGRNHFKKGHYTAIEEAGLKCIDWTVDSLDWSKPSADDIFNQVLAEQKHNMEKNQVVLLFHEKKYTLEVLPRIIYYYRSLGYEFMPYFDGQELDCILSSKK